MPVTENIGPCECCAEEGECGTCQTGTVPGSFDVTPSGNADRDCTTGDCDDASWGTITLPNVGGCNYVDEITVCGVAVQLNLQIIGGSLVLSISEGASLKAQFQGAVGTDIDCTTISGVTLSLVYESGDGQCDYTGTSFTATAA